jgi:hypothetical protein
MRYQCSPCLLAAAAGEAGAGAADGDQAGAGSGGAVALGQDPAGGEDGPRGGLGGADAACQGAVSADVWITVRQLGHLTRLPRSCGGIRRRLWQLGQPISTFMGQSFKEEVKLV